MSTPKLAIQVVMEAKSGKEAEVQKMLAEIQAFSKEEPGTLQWYGTQNGSTFGIFDTFADEAGRDAHLNGKGAALLMSKANSGEVFAKPLVLNKLNLTGAKV